MTFDNRTGKEAAAALAAQLPGDTLLAAMLRSDGFVALPPKEQQDLLFALSGGETDSEWFQARLEPDEIEVIDHALASLLKGSALADSLYKTAYDLRAVANKDVKQLEPRATAASNTAQPTAVATDELEAAVAGLREKQGKLQAKLGAGNSGKQAHAAATLRHQQADVEVKRAEAALLAAGDDSGYTPHDVGALDAAVQKRRDEHGEAVQAVTSANARRAALQEQLEQFVALGDKCILGGVACPMDAASRAKSIKGAQKDIDKLEQGIADAREAAATAKSFHDTASSALDAANKQTREHEAWAQRVASLTEQAEQAGERRRAAWAECQEFVEPNVEALEKELQVVVGQIAGLETELRSAREAATLQADAKRLQSDLQKAQDRAELLDGLVKKLSPDGLPAQAMRETIGSVVEAINEVLAEFTDFLLVATPGKEFELSVSDVDGVMLPVRCLSESEKLRVGVGVQVAFAKLPTVPGPNGQRKPFGFVVVDAADRCDLANLRGLLAMLLDSGVQALVTSTPLVKRVQDAQPGEDGECGWHDETAVPSAEGLAVYRLEDGKVVEA